MGDDIEDDDNIIDVTGTPIGEFIDNVKKQYEEAGLMETADEINWMAVRKGDIFPRYSKDVKWIEWGDDLRAKELLDEPAIALSMLMSPFNGAFTWQTTPIEELILVTEKKIHFKTTNSEYMLFKGNMDLFKSKEHVTMVQEFING